MHWEERLSEEKVNAVYSILERLDTGILNADEAYDELVASGLTAEEANEMVNLEA